MFKVVVTLVRTGDQEIIFADDFQSDDVKLCIYKGDSALTYLLHSVESFYVETLEEEQ